jgi:hypothetical protein
MKTLFVFLLTCSLFFAMPNVSKAERPTKKSSCIKLVYPMSPTNSIFYSGRYNGPKISPVKKNLGKLKGVKGKTKNHKHFSRFLGKLEGIQIWTTNFRKED